MCLCLCNCIHLQCATSQPWPLAVSLRRIKKNYTADILDDSAKSCSESLIRVAMDNCKSDMAEGSVGDEIHGADARRTSLQA